MARVSSMRGLAIGIAALALALGGGTALLSQDLGGFAQEDENDQTRVHGTVYGSDGRPLARVDVRVFNDAAPANEVRTRTRKTGSYVARGFGRLFTERDVYGLRARVRFEAEEYVPTEVVSAVEKNNAIELNPILWREDEDPASHGGWSVIVEGRVTDHRGRKVRGATWRLTSPDDPSLLVEGEADRKGRFEALLWNGPSRFVLEVSADGVSESVPVELQGTPRNDLVAQVTRDVQLGE